MATDPRLPAGWSTPIPPRRVAPLAVENRSAETDALLDMLRSPNGDVFNIFATLAHHPRLLKRWSAFGGTLLLRGELPDRDRELLILRTAWNCRAHYEWAHHDEIARAAGLSSDEIARVTEGPEAPGWTAHDALLLRAADELHQTARMTDATWAALAERYDEAPLIEICMLVGQYHLVAFTLNTLGIQLES